MIPYNIFKYVYPPRPENALPSTLLNTYDNNVYIGSPKLNGDCMLIFTNGIETHIRDRHNKPFLKAISPSLLPQLKKLHKESADDKKNKWMCIVGEYMIKSKKDGNGKLFNEKFVIFDIIVFDSMQLIGKTFLQRQELLDDLYGCSTEAHPGCYIDKFLYSTEHKDIYRARYFTTSFLTLWNELVDIDMYEGWVLKMANSPLENGLGEKNNTKSQVKFRKPTKNYKH